MNLDVILLANIIIDAYFNETECLFIFTDPGSYFDYYRGHSKVIFAPKNATIDSKLVFNNLGCRGLIIYSKYPRSLFDNFEDCIRHADERYNTRKYLIVPVDGAAEDVLNIFESPRIQFVADIDIIVKSNHTKDYLSFDIVTHKYVGTENHNETITLDTWFANNRSFLHGNCLYPNKLKNQFGKTLRLETIDYHPFSDTEITEGTDWYLIKELLKQLNTTFEIINDNRTVSSWFGDVYPNFTGFGIFGNIAEDRVDIGFGALYQWDKFTPYMDYSRPGIQTAITCLVPRPEMLGGWLTPFIALSGPIWISIGFTAMISIILLYFILAWDHMKRLKATKVKTKKILLDSIIQTQAMYTGQSVLRIPMNFSSRLVFALILIMCLILDVIYDSGLASNMTIPRYYGIIRNAKDMVDINLQWGAPDPAFLYSLKNSESITQRKMMDLFVLATEDELRGRSDEKRFSFAIERLPEGNFVTINYITVEGVKIRRALDEPLYTGYIIYAARKSSILLPYIDDIILRSAETGLVSKWEYEAVEKYSVINVLKIVKESDPSNTLGPTKLKLSHVEGAFYILIIGLFMSTLCFIYELLMYKR